MRHFGIHIIYFLAIGIFPTNPKTAKGWKNGDTFSCDEETGEQFIKCIQDETYSAQDVLLTTNNSSDLTTVFSEEWNGLAHFLDVDIEFDKTRFAFLQLNPNISYLLLVADPKLKGLLPYYIIIFWGVLPPLVVK